MATFIMAAALGVVVGVLSGLLGIGGGTVMVPMFRLGFGLSAIEATATSLFTIIPTSLAGCVTHVRNKTCIVSLGVAAGIGGALTSPVGVWLASISPAWAIMLAAALIIGYSAVNMLRKAMKTPPALRASDVANKEKPAETVEKAALNVVSSDLVEAPRLTRKQLATGAAIGLVAGIASGYVGVGGGFIMVPLFVSIIGTPMKKTSGTSLIAVTILAIPGVIEQALLGHVQFVPGIAMAVGTIPGAVLGAQLVKRIPERALRFLFGAFLLVVAVILAFNEFSAA